MGYAPENTLISFRKALELGASCVELDVYNVQGSLLVIHDERLERTTSGSGFVMDHDLAHLRSLTLEQNQRIPTLEEVYREVGQRAGINIELKGPNTAGAVADFIAAQPSAEWALVSSFNPQALKAVCDRNTGARIGVLLPEFAAGWDHLDISMTVEQFNPYSLHLPLKNVTAGVVAKAQAAGLRVFVYTVNQPEDIARMAEFGVDGVFTDYPDRVKLPPEKGVVRGWP